MPALVHIGRRDAKKPDWLGLGPSEPDTYTGAMERPEKWLLYLFCAWLAVALVGTLIFVYAPDRSIASIFALPDSSSFARFGFIALSTVLLYIPMGIAVEKLGVNVAFTRKAGHIIAVFILPMMSAPALIGKQDFYREWYQTMVWQSIGIVVLPYCLFLRPIRSRVRFLYYCMRAIDRPEDRPYTLLWFCSQILATSVILVPMTQYYVHLDLWSLYLIPAMACGLGDGLAEPVGKVFGKKKYRTRALFVEKEYTRTYVGSACVWFFTALGVLFNVDVLTTKQFLFLIVTVPLCMALTEAFSPHTWDNWFMYIVCGILVHIALHYAPLL